MAGMGAAAAAQRGGAAGQGVVPPAHANLALFTVILVGREYVGGNVDACYFAHSRGQAGVDFCVAYDYCKSGTFSSNMYGLNDASTLAREWARRMSYYAGIARPFQNHYVFGPADHFNYSESFAFVQMMATAQGDLLRRGQEIRAIHP